MVQSSSIYIDKNMFYLNWWTNDTKSPDYDYTKFITYLSSCYTNFNSNYIIWYSVFGPFERLKMGSKDKCIKIYFTGENTASALPEYRDENNIAEYVDIVAGFFTSTPKSVRLPLWIMYYSFYEKGLWKPIESKTRQMSASLIARHDRFGNRVPLIQQAVNIGIPVYTTLGIQGHMLVKHVQIGQENKDKIDLCKETMFNICPENSIMDGYITEKVFQASEAGCIPVYIGPDPVEPCILNQQRIIREFNADKLNNAVTIQKLSVWEEDAYYHICVIYLKFWTKLKSIYEEKFHTLCMKEDIETIIYEVNELSRDDIEKVLKQHWRDYHTLWKPLAKIKCNNKIYILEELTHLL